MQTRHLARTSWRLLLNQWRRTLITAATFAIGLGAFAVFHGVTSAAARQLEAVLQRRGAANVLTVVPARLERMGNRDVELTSFRSLRVTDAGALAAQLGARADVAPVRTTTAAVRHRTNKTTTAVIGTVSSYFAAANARVASGELWTESDARRPVAVIGLDLATELFGYENPIGKRIAIGEHSFVVTGVLMGGRLSDEDTDLRVIVPLRYTSAEGMAADQLSTITVRVAGDGHRDAIAAEITRVLRARHRLPDGAENDFTVRDERALIEAQQQVSDLFRIVLPAISLVSLVAGGIGIFTVMLLATRERAGEIGLRRAIGAARMDVLVQFVIEALLIAAPSALLGEIGGTIASMIIAARFGWPAGAMEVRTLAAAFAGAMVFAIICSIIPARRAAHLDPAAALRS